MRGVPACATATFFCLFLSVNGFSQTVNATVGGTAADSSGALIPGATVAATNTGTGIVNKTITNESGAYSFPSLQPGTYKVSAELSGFRTETYTDVQLGGGQQVRLNFTLQVGAVGTNVEVSISADTLLATSSSVLSTVLPEYKLRDLPTAAGNVFNLVQNLPGVQRNAGGTFGFMAGGQLGDVNATRDGVNVNDGRYENGAWSVVFTSPDIVEEVKVVIAPVDAETSRGSGQVSMVTRSGTNQFKGSAHWSNHNSVLDANDWFNNFSGVPGSYDNRNQYGIRFGGPVIKSKTFFFAAWEGQRDLKKSVVNGLTFTDYAKAGIFRYWPGADPANASNANPSVDVLGNAVKPSNATGDLAAIGLFGSCNYKGAPVPNCKVFNDLLRPAISTNAFLQEQLRRMPSPNRFTTAGTINGDGLNTAIINFVRRQDGLDLTNGNGDEVDRDSYTARIDHNFNTKQKLSLIATKEKTWGTAAQSGLRAWPLGYDGLAVKRPYVYTIQLTSTLTPSLLNQLRLSKRASNNWQWPSANRGDEIGAEAKKLHATANGIPYQVGFASGITSFSLIGGFGRWREGINPMRAIGDDLSWTVRKHAFKTGIEWRRQESNGFNDPNYTPNATLGAGNNATTGLDGTNFSGLTGNAATTARNILYDLSASVDNIRQSFGIVSATETKLVGTPIVPNNRERNYQSEFSAYFKDDWKFRSDLTLNLGIHWEWYGQPYEHNGLAARIVGDESAFFKVQCTGSPGTIGFTSACTNLTEVQFVGKNSTHPEIGSYLNGNDNNNFAPAVGLAWNVPWFGRGKTVVRAGYGINYEGALRNFINVSSDIGTVPGINLVGSSNNGLQYLPSAYTSLNAVALPIPFPTGTPTTSPFVVSPTDRTLGITTYNHVSPYTQNWNFELQHEVARNTTVEVRYIGTKGTKLWSGVDLNSINWIKQQPDLFREFNIVRAGGDSPLFTQMLMGVGLAGTPVVNGTVTGAQVLRTNVTTRAQLANGNYGAFLTSLNTTLNYTGNPSSDRGSILRRAGYPENFLVPAPQYSGATIQGNNQNSTYHSLNLQFTRRLSNGFSTTSSYIWSKALGAGAVVDPNNRNESKALQATDHRHQITANGTYELPFGTNHFLLGNAPGWAQRLVEKWQLGGIFNFTTGAPISITSGLSTISGNTSRPAVLAAIPSDFGKLKKCSTANPCYAGTASPLTSGVVFFDGYSQVADPNLAAVSPACAASTTACNGMSTAYTNKAIADPNGNIILVNPQPGQIGTLGYTTVRGPRTMYFDLDLIKRIRVTETKSFEFRLDAINILNHPNFAAPSSAINGNNNFGRITSLLSGANLGGNGGMRSFIVNTRFNF